MGAQLRGDILVIIGMASPSLHIASGDCDHLISCPNQQDS